MVSFMSALRNAAVGKALSPVDQNRGWFPLIRESFAGAWQNNVEVKPESVLAYHAVFACMTLIASDVAKLRVKLIGKTEGDVWQEITNPAYTPVLRKPNYYQTRIQFWESWMLSKLSRGNTYVLKERDERGVVRALYILEPKRVKPMVSSEDGSVWYELQTDWLSGLPTDTVLVPASEIIHDRFNCLFHPLVGLSPIFACGLAAMQGLAIQNNSTNLFQNASRPGGLLIAPGEIRKEDAQRLKEYWDSGFSGQNSGKVAVLGDGLKYEALSVTPEDAQLIEQLKWTAEVVCSTFHVPPYKIGVGDMPSYNNVQALNVEYYSQCLQALIESAELCLDEGLSLGENIGVEFDLYSLLRMDSVTQMDMLTKAAGVMSPNEMRKKLDLPPVPGGGSPYLQQQNYSLEALAERDANSPLVTPGPNPQTGAQAVEVEDADEPDEEEVRAMKLREKAYLMQLIRSGANA
jgi:HK97 family phage portal protein